MHQGWLKKLNQTKKIEQRLANIDSYISSEIAVHLDILEKNNFLELSADRLFRIMKEGKIKIDIAHKYSLDEAQKSHEDLHARKLIGPAILIP